MQRQQFLVHAQAETEHWWFRARRRILREIISTLLPPGKDRILVDVGCGTGGNSAALSEDYSCTGIDNSPDAIAIARERYPATPFVCGLAPQDILEASRRADLFLMSDVLEHIEDDFRALSELLAVAKPGAYFVLTVPADPGLWSKHDESHGHYRRYHRARFERLWQNLPITPLFVSHMNARLFPVIKTVRTVNRWLRRSSGDADTDVRTPIGPVNRFLEMTFAGERHRLRALLGNSDQTAYRRGVSLIGVLRREPGQILPLNRPADVEPNMWDPQAVG